MLHPTHYIFQQNSLDTSGMNGYAQDGPEATPDLDVAAGVSSVQELLPDLGAGFIRECLRLEGIEGGAVRRVGWDGCVFCFVS